MSLKQYNLSGLASIHSGVTFRGKVEDDPEGDASVIQLRNVAADFSGLQSMPCRAKSSSFRSHNFLREGDLLFVAKGKNNFCLPYKKEYGRAVAVSFFFVIRPLEEMRGAFDPLYLNWYINSQQAQRQLKKGKEGTLTININKKSLGDLIVKLPPLKQQKTIAKINELKTRENQLLKTIQKKREQLISHQLLTFINSHKSTT
ncbi:MAG TPA: restriction endonuclease subunit S [Bacteroidetes bacterium]|nr:restriction endonuclease subunit S [Bacteroidota bacterium]